MNAPTYIAGTKPLVKAVKEGLLVGGKAAMLGLPLKPLKQLYVDPALDYLTAQGADIRCGTPVDAVVVDKSDRVSGVMVEGELLPAKGVILALPPYEVTGRIPRRWRSDPFFSRVSEFSYAPIASVHMAFDRPVLPVRFGHLPRAFTHWVFGRGRSEASGWANLSALISYAPDRAEAMVEAIGSQALEDIRDRLPEARNAKLLRLKTVRIARATVVLKPNTDRLRAVSRTPVKGLYLAGDWCQTGLPATIESAARSGDEAAKAALADA